MKENPASRKSLSTPTGLQGRYKFYYLYRSACKTTKNVNGAVTSISFVKGIPAVTICIMQDENGMFHRGVSVASESEMYVMKAAGRYYAHRRMVKAFFAGQYGSKDPARIPEGGALHQIRQVMEEGPTVDNPAKYIPKVLRTYWETCADTSEFERRLFDNGT